MSPKANDNLNTIQQRRIKAFLVLQGKLADFETEFDEQISDMTDGQRQEIALKLFDLHEIVGHYGKKPGKKS